MPHFNTDDGTNLYYRDWGKGRPVIFVSSWALGGDMWEYQMLALSNQNLRCIAYDRRGHGRSDDPGHGFDPDTLANDLDSLIRHLDLSDVVLVGHSMGCAEIARYLSNYGAGRITKTVLVSPIRLVRKPEDPEEMFTAGYRQGVGRLMTDRARYMAEGVIKFFGIGSEWPAAPKISPELVQWGLQLISQPSLKAIVDCWEYVMWAADFGDDLKAFTMPTLIIHGDADHSAPLPLCGLRLAEAIPGSDLKVYEGAPHGLFLTEMDRLSRDLCEFVSD